MLVLGSSFVESLLFPVHPQGHQNRYSNIKCKFWSITILLQPQFQWLQPPLSPLQRMGHKMQPLMLPRTLVSEGKFAKIQFFSFYVLDGYFWTLITTLKPKNQHLNSKTSFFFEKARWVTHHAWAFYKVTQEVFFGTLSIFQKKSVLS